MTPRQIVAWVSVGLLLIAIGTLVGIAATRAMDLPPSDGKSLAGIVQSIEEKDLGAIRSVEYERDWWKITGMWEVMVCKESCLKLYIDPKTGDERRRKSDDLEDELPPANTQGPSGIAKSFEDRKSGFITEIEFEHGAWQVKYREARGLSGALQPAKKRVFEPTRVPLTMGKPAPVIPPPEMDMTPPAQLTPMEPFDLPPRETLIRVAI
jgi:hypothetical protein